MSFTVLRIAGSAIAIGIAVMIISVSVVTGFKNEIFSKFIGTQSHITIKNRDINGTFETLPIENNIEFKKNISSISGINHIQIFATKPGIIKVKDEVQGIVLKGISSDFDWKFMEKTIIEGQKINISETQTDEIIISKKLAGILNYKLGDKVNIFFINEKPKGRSFKIAGIYDTGVEEFDKLFVICDIKKIIGINDWKDNQISGYEVFVDDFDNLEKTANIVRDETSSLIYDDGTMMQVSDFYQNNEMLVAWLKLSDTNVIVILSLMIIVATLTMISALLTIILERTNMIGILKAVGAKDFDIMKIFVINGTLLIAKAMFFGNIIALILLFIQHKYSIIPLNPDIYYLESVPVDFNVLNIILLNVGAIFISSVSLLIPSLLVAKINPSETVKFK
jgi:lipoprotein-releasing system permease protein